MSWSSAVLTSCALSLMLVSCSPEEWSTLVGVELIFPEEQSPLDGATVLRVEVVPDDEEELDEGEDDELVQTFERPSAGSWDGFEVRMALGRVDISSAQIVVEALDSSGNVLSAGESIPIPLQSGKVGRTGIFFQNLGTSASAPGFEQTWTGHGAAYLDGGGVLVTSGEEGAATAETWVYAVDFFEPIRLADLPGARSLAVVSPLDARLGLLIGGSQPSTEAHVYDPLADAWEALELPEEGQGSWPTPVVGVLSDGGVLALRDNVILRFSPGPPSAVGVLGELPTEIASATLTVAQPELALVIGEGEPFMYGFDPRDGDVVEVALPLAGARNGHSAAALSTGQVVLVGGQGAELLEDVEIYDPESDSWTVLEDLLAGHARIDSRLVTLRDDRLVLVGGVDGDGQPLSNAVVIDIDDAEVEVIELATERSGHTATVLPTGAVLIIGGTNASGDALDSVEVLRPY